MSRFGERVVFGRIGWMKLYRGSVPGDERPLAGGSYPDIKHEITNFLPRATGPMYGYFAPPMQSDSVRLERIVPGSTGDSLDRVLVVFFARDMEGNGGQRVVGWYKDATVSREYRVAPRPRSLKGLPPTTSYCVTARKTDVVLLPTRARNWHIPRGKGNPGQANVFYLYESNGSPKKVPWLKTILNEIERYDGPNLVLDPAIEFEDEASAPLEAGIAEREGAPFQQNPKIRKCVEQYAEQRARRWWVDNNKGGWSITHRGKPYDFLCERGKAKHYIEVKGTQGLGTAIVLTTGEVRFAQKNAKTMTLVVVHSIKVEKVGRNKYKPSGGVLKTIRPWKPRQKDLSPLQFQYQLTKS